jgi:hypothetical protein
MIASFNILSIIIAITDMLLWSIVAHTVFMSINSQYRRYLVECVKMEVKNADDELASKEAETLLKTIGV